ncbi:MAG: radical SAM protein [Saprospiraceae bacterium]|nr:radical SAM protein [Saprospiraceae bacterium]
MSNTCNLEDIMCSGQVSSSIRTHRDHLPPLPMPYDDAFVTQLREFIPHLHEAKFYGGEPFLIPIYYQIWEAIAELKPELFMFVITNGTVLNSRVKDLLQKGRFELAVSIDALDKTKLESIRKNVHLETLLEHIDYFSTYSRQHHRPLH